MSCLKIPAGMEYIGEFDKEKFLVKHVKINAPYESRTEVHRNYIDIFLVKEGEAKVLTSDSFSGGIEEEKGEIRDCGMHNPILYIIKPGDILIIPEKTAHKVIIERSSLVQTVIKIKV